jgi:tetratricopeptide (TPR) repeat protein
MRHAPGREKRRIASSIACFAVAVALFLAPCTSATQAQDATYDTRLEQAYASAYNLDHDAAVRELEALAKIEPDLPSTYRALASITWLRLLFSRGTVLVDEYLGRIARHDVHMAAPPADVTADFSRHLTRAISLAEARVERNPRDARAQYDLSSAMGLHASWVATVEGRMGRAFGSARRAYKAAERATALDPDDPDPRLILGTYRYVVSGLNLPTRWVAYMAGLDGDRARGLQLLEQAAASASPVRTEARFALVLLYNREKRWDDALRVLSQLRDDYPRNRLLWLETGATALRAGRSADALRWLAAGYDMASRDTRRRMFGEEALWRLKRAQALRGLGRLADARADVLTGLAALDARDWVRGRTHLEFGEIALAQGDADQARWQAAKAVPLLERGADPEGVRQARRLLERAGRG